MENQEKNCRWKDVTREELIELSHRQKWSDAMIAEHYEVTPSSVRYKRKKLKVTRADMFYADFMNGEPALMEVLNQNFLEWFRDPANIDQIAKSITNYIFRSGPVEDIHADRSKNLTDGDMKTLNIFMVNQIAGLLQYALMGDWLRLRVLLDGYSLATGGWQEAEPDVEELQRLSFQPEEFEQSLDRMMKQICKQD